MKDNIVAIIGATVGVIAFIAFLIHVSLYRDTIIRVIIKTIKAICLIGLLPLAYITYPNGIMNIALAQVTVGEIGRLFISIILILFFIAVVVFLIRRSYDYE